MADETANVAEQKDVAAEMTEHEKLVASFPEHLRTHFTETDLTCPKCGSIWQPGVATFINDATDPAGREGILRKTIHKSRCPACKRYEFDIFQIFDFYLPGEKLIVQVRPAWEIRAGGEDYYWNRMDDLVMKYQEEDVHVDLVFGLDEMIEKHLGGDEEIERAQARRQREIELVLAPGSILNDEQLTASYDSETEPEGQKA